MPPCSTDAMVVPDWTEEYLVLDHGAEVPGSGLNQLRQHRAGGGFDRGGHRIRKTNADSRVSGVDGEQNKSRVSLSHSNHVSACAWRIGPGVFNWRSDERPG